MKTLTKIFAIAALAVAGTASAQVKKPTIMVIPSDTWCNSHGYVQKINNQGKVSNVPDYEAAVSQNTELMSAIIKIQELMTDRGMNVKDLAKAIKSINQNNAEDEMLTSRSSGASLAQTPLERLKNVAKADLILELSYDVKTTGPKRSLWYALRALDAYTDAQVAASSGNGPASFSADTPVLLEEAVLANIDPFTAQLQDHFEDMLENGREVVLNIKVFDNGSGLSLEDEYGGEMLQDIIENWVADNTVNNRFNLSDASDYVMRFEQVRIPLYRANGRAMDTRAFVNQLRQYLANPPYNIPAKLVISGLGKAELILGEK
ncbi:MAG: DUF6175 family protein [Bacteroides sp.]|nr:DUF6175 family protein [Bacteroides sp.]MCM1379696.1 DUF6175 family protein [Bacteroides sp.]MCM1446051.1 DUF6175 family protein [Prevotella sp.]